MRRRPEISGQKGGLLDQAFKGIEGGPVVTSETAKPAKELRGSDWAKLSEEAFTLIGLTIEPNQYDHIMHTTEGPDALD